MKTENQLKTLETYFNLMSINGSSQVFHIAHKLNIFSALNNNLKTLHEIAEYCELKEKPLEMILEVLCSLNVIENHDDGYYPSPVMSYLAGNYQSLGNQYWEHLTTFLKTGDPLVCMDDNNQSEKLYESQVTSLYWMMKPSAETAASILQIGDKRKQLDILDVGAGSAVWSLTLNSRDSGGSITALDWPEVLKIAEKFSVIEGVKDNFYTIPGSYHEVEIPENTYDLIVVGNVAHIETEESNVSLFKKLRRSLKNNGEIVVFDVFSGQEKGDIQRTLYRLGLGLRTKHGNVYSYNEIEHFLKKAGFNHFINKPIPVTPYTMGMIIAK